MSELNKLFREARDAQLSFVRFLKRRGLSSNPASIPAIDPRFLAEFVHHDEYMEFLDFQRAARIATDKYLRAIGKAEASEQGKAAAAKRKAAQEGGE